MKNFIDPAQLILYNKAYAIFIDDVDYVDLMASQLMQKRGSVEQLSKAMSMIFHFVKKMNSRSANGRKGVILCTALCIHLLVLGVLEKSVGRPVDLHDDESERERKNWIYFQIHYRNVYPLKKMKC